MGFFEPKELYSWTPEARAEVEQIAAALRQHPDCRIGLTLRRPAIFRGRCLIVAAYRDGIAARVSHPGVRPLSWPLAVRGLTAFGPAGIADWADVATRAYEQAG